MARPCRKKLIHGRRRRKVGVGRHIAGFVACGVESVSEVAVVWVLKVSGSIILEAVLFVLSWCLGLRASDPFFTHT
eukprot:5313564-Amphidinium_carterae.1